ncbi:MAG: hypothetical protein J07HN4v3_01722 [Halonotius sp. J07HN4]|jgi:hypothetical protein|nr:MAG: hypothetical protein J07HN4v3_01722 [Halonotius sp. J07HN4]
MPDQNGGTGEQTIPVSPTVNIETFATHCTATWKAESLAQCIETLQTSDCIEPTATVVVDDTTIAGREQQSVRDITPTETIRYLRVTPAAPWTLSWEQRTWPVVSMSGTLSAEACRHMHVGTTECSGWPDTATATVKEIISGI